MRVLVVAAHPDDEVLGVGGTICRHIEKGDEVYVIICTVASPFMWDDNFREQKLKEQKEVNKLLGITKRIQLQRSPAIFGEDDPYISLMLDLEMKGRISFELFKHIQEIQPDVIYTHYDKDLHTDHQIVSHCTLVAARSEHYKGKVLMYEVPCEKIKPFAPNYYVSLTEEQLVKKMDAFEIYKSEVKEAPHLRSIDGISTLLLLRGHEAGMRFAEAFILVREVIQ